jgi:hypothetical protein
MPPPAIGPFAELKEKIMSKSNDSSKFGRTPQVRELGDDELQRVSGGYVYDATHVMVEGIVATQTKTTCTRMASFDVC